MNFRRDFMIFILIMMILYSGGLKADSSAGLMLAQASPHSTQKGKEIKVEVKVERDLGLYISSVLGVGFCIPEGEVECSNESLEINPGLTFTLKAGYKLLPILAIGMELLLFWNPLSGIFLDEGSELDVGVGGFAELLYRIIDLIEITGRVSFGYATRHTVMEFEGGSSEWDNHGIFVGVEGGARYIINDFISVGGVLGYYRPIFIKSCSEGSCSDIEDKGDVDSRFYIGANVGLLF